MASTTPPHLLPPKHRDPLLSEEYATFLDKVYSKLCKQLPDYISSLLDTFRHDMTEKEYQDFKELDESPTTVSLIINWVYKDKDRFIPFVKFIVFQVPHIYIGMPSLPVCSSFAHPKSQGCESSLFDDEYTSDDEIPPVAYRLSNDSKYLNYAYDAYREVKQQLIPRKARLVFLLQRLYKELGLPFLLMCESHGLYSPQYELPSGYTIEELLHKDCTPLIKAHGLYTIMLEHSSMHDLYILCYVILPFFKNPNIGPFVKSIKAACRECKVDLLRHRVKIFRVNSV